MWREAKGLSWFCLTPLDSLLPCSVPQISNTSGSPQLLRSTLLRTDRRIPSLVSQELLGKLSKRRDSPAALRLLYLLILSLDGAERAL